MSSGRWTAVLVIPAIVLGLARPIAQQEPSSPTPPDPAGVQPDLPRFRAEANFVRVDVYVTKDGVAVQDLTAADFEVLEDGKPQKIETFEHVNIRGNTPQETRVEPQTVAEGRAAAEDPRARVFVIFLDTYNTDYAGSHRMQSVVINLLDRLLGENDVFAVMTPEMSPRDLAFARRTGTTAGLLAKYWAWGREGTIANFDPEEEAYMSCYPPHSAPDLAVGCKRSDYTGVAHEMIERRREYRALSALNDLALYLRDLREERKAVVTISSGWLLYTPNPRLARKLDCDPVPGIPPIGVNPKGRLTNDPQTHGYGSQYQCDKDRMTLAQLDNRQYFLDILDRANRANVSFYPVDAQGLRVWNKDLSYSPLGQPNEIQPPAVDAAQLRGRIETLRTLAEYTDGLAIVDTNNLDKGMRRIVDDLTSYYLLGYYAENSKLDGRFRSIKVRVKHPGVEVRARRGYKAATREEFEKGRKIMETLKIEAPPSGVLSALSSLAGIRRDTRMFSHASWVAAPIDGPADAKSHVWVVGEINPSTARSAEWAAGGEAEVTITAEDDTTVATTKQAVEPAAKTVSMTLPDIALGPGDYVLRLRLRPASPGIPLIDTIRFTVSDSGTPVGRPRLRRRGPTTGPRYVETATPTFQRTERVRVEVPILGGADGVTAELLDRNGKTIAVPVQSGLQRDEAGALTWGTAELVLAPLAPGDYVIKTSIQRGTTREEVVTAFRMVP
jgi:VWFA-related protein